MLHVPVTNYHKQNSLHKRPFHIVLQTEYFETLHLVTYLY